MNPTLVNLGWQLAGWGVSLLIVIGGPLLAKALNDRLKASTSATQYRTLQLYAGDLVHAAEQYLASSTGQAQKAWVMTALEAYLKARGWSVPLSMLDGLVESNVHYMKALGAPLPAAPVDTPKPSA